MVKKNFSAATNPPVTGYLARPTEAGPWPAVVVVHEAFGLTGDIARVADRIAERGYLALAVDLFAGNTVMCLVSAMRGVVTGKGGPALDQIDSARRTLAARADCTGTVGIIGFCMGGAFAILAAGRHDFDASAPAYGIAPKNLDQVLRGSCPMVASYGKKDPQTRGTAQRLEDSLTRLGIEHDVKEYPDAGHGFMVEHTGIWSVAERVPGLRPAPAASDDSWRRVFAFFDQHLRAGSTGDATD